MAGGAPASGFAAFGFGFALLFLRHCDLLLEGCVTPKHALMSRDFSEPNEDAGIKDDLLAIVDDRRVRRDCQY
jgi:hypothetical protein